ncbi:hypothetical protein EVAR_774_1 [Eumeta japonica]|uniref:Uncharacterized protein n=1 Tax=Eumeta variegata TaxID=151549 RepID=A0A4C1SC35_EUMVA|nr:hypothetical protein EVAR_774_1 [Eumeta japonica]
MVRRCSAIGPVKSGGRPERHAPRAAGAVVVRQQQSAHRMRPRGSSRQRRCDNRALSVRSRPLDSTIERIDSYRVCASRAVWSEVKKVTSVRRSEEVRGCPATRARLSIGRRRARRSCPATRCEMGHRLLSRGRSRVVAVCVRRPRREPPACAPWLGAERAAACLYRLSRGWHTFQVRYLLRPPRTVLYVGS